VRDSLETLTGESQLSDTVTLKILRLNSQIIMFLIGAAGASAVTGRRLSSCWVYFLTAAGIPALALAFVSVFAGVSSPAFT
jgi:hypothetical protein